MNYLWILVFIILIVGFVFYRGIVNERNRKKKRLNDILSLVGKYPQASLRCNPAKSAAGALAIGDNEREIDDITWENLDLEDVYKRMNYSLTRQGADYLYDMLHNPVTSIERLEALEAFIRLADQNKEELIRLFCDYVNYAPAVTPAVPSSKVDNPVREALNNIAYLIALALMCVNVALGVIAFLLVASYMIVTYFSKKNRMAYMLYQVGQIITIYKTSRSLSAFTYLREANDLFSTYEQVDTECLIESGLIIKKVARLASWFGNGAASGMDTILVYLKMLFHVDLIALYALEANMEKYIEAARIPGRFIGLADASLSIALWRASMDSWSRPEFVDAASRNTSDGCAIKDKEGFLPGSEIEICEAAHPLLAKPVESSISVDDKGVLLTGSNASGKSTFLKNMALQLILAQTVNTVSAKRVRLPLCRVITAMGVKDNLLKGDSYYMAEIKAIRRILDMDSERSGRPVVCFLDEILRGTNTKERIAGSAAILKHMIETGYVVFCATHDRELTFILENQFDNYHFCENIVDGDISFNYELNVGRANSSNAISLLKFIGFNDEIISEANKLLADC